MDSLPETNPTVPTPDTPNPPASFTGYLKMFVTSTQGLLPIPNAKVTISYTGSPTATLGTFYTDESGQTEAIPLPAPNPSLSQAPSDTQPYSEYTLRIEAPGYETEVITGSELLANTLSIQPIRMTPLSSDELREDIIIIPAHTLYADYPPKIPEDEIKTNPDTGEIILSEVVIPEYVIVHDGVPTDSSAQNYWVRYKDYIKNVASSEIYPTWPEAAIYANILAIMSFTLNRVYTEWYPGKGYDFTITSSTAYDQKWIFGRNIFSNIDVLVDSVFANYISKPGVNQPLFTAYCDGRNTTCQGLRQWGSKYLADEGYSAIEILRYYYGNDVFINTTTEISGVPSSYPGYVLTTGSTGDKVRQLQRQLNRISQNYPAIPKLSEDGIYGAQTKASVSAFQRIFNLPQTGDTDYATWYEISNIYVGVTRISEPA